MTDKPDLVTPLEAEAYGTGQTVVPYTVTSHDMIFRYPDRVPLTHFVHRAKKGFGMWA
jgi:hypothetical protein